MNGQDFETRISDHVFVQPQKREAEELDHTAIGTIQPE
jgi:hypothetical protein